MEPESPPGLFLLGGQSTDGQLASIETFGFDNCSIPPLPETRYGFGSFIVPTEPPQLAVCGGWWTGTVALAVNNALVGRCGFGVAAASSQWRGMVWNRYRWARWCGVVCNI